MGYSYDMQNRLCCDFCDASGGVRKVRCPFNWCQPAAVCPSCKVTHADELKKPWHAAHGCEKAAAQFTLEHYRRKELLAAGRYIRSAALGHGERCKVYFEHKDGGRCFWMPTAVYQGLGYGQNLTLEDYQAAGPVTPAANANLYDAETMTQKGA